MLNKTRLITLIAILAAAAGTLVFRTPSVLFLLATLVAAPILASALAQLMSRGLRVSRQMPLVGSVGDEVRARLVVRNEGVLPALLVHAQGRGADEKAARGRFGRRRAAETAAEAAQPAFFRALGEPELVVPILMPGAGFEGEIAWQLTRRGSFLWPGARAGTVDPVGLSDPLPARGAPSELLVLPRYFKLRRLPVGGGTPSARPQRYASVSAESAEIHGVRPYQPGEGGRRIHWRATARTGQLHVLEWEEESAADLTLLLDVFAPHIAGAPGDDSLEISITAAASVAAFLLENGQRIRIFWWANAASPVAPGAVAGIAVGATAGAGGPRLMRVEARHRAGLTALLTALARIAPCDEAGATLAALSQRVQRESGDEGALLLGSDRADWSAALAAWPSGRGRAGARGLALEAASFDQARAGASLSLGAGRAVVATMRRADASNAADAPSLPSQVRRIARADSLVDTLEKGF